MSVDDFPSDYYTVLHYLSQVGCSVEAIDLNTLVLRDGEALCSTFTFNDAGKFLRVFNHRFTFTRDSSGKILGVTTHD